MNKVDIDKDALAIHEYDVPDDELNLASHMGYVDENKNIDILNLIEILKEKAEFDTELEDLKVKDPERTVEDDEILRQAWFEKQKNNRKKNYCP